MNTFALLMEFMRSLRPVSEADDPLANLISLAVFVPRYQTMALRSISKVRMSAG